MILRDKYGVYETHIIIYSIIIKTLIIYLYNTKYAYTIIYAKIVKNKSVSRLLNVRHNFLSSIIYV